MSFFFVSFRLIRSFFLVSFVRSFGLRLDCQSCYGAVILWSVPRFFCGYRGRESLAVHSLYCDANLFPQCFRGCVCSCIWRAIRQFLRDSYFLLCFHSSASDSSQYCAFSLVPGETGRGGGSTCPCLSIIPFHTRT